MKELLNRMNLYTNNQLQTFFLDLENKYNITNLSYKYNNSVNFSENEKLPFHNWFRYREGFSGNLVKELIIESGIETKEIVLDPFSGSGTTPVVASLEGYNSIGIDVNPLSTYISNVKMKHFTKSDIEICRKSLDNLPDLKSYIETKPIEIAKYFEKDNLKALYCLKQFICQIENENSKSILFVSLLSIVETCSNRRRDGNGLKIVKTKVTDVYSIFKEKTNLILNDLENSSDKLKGYGQCITESAINLYNVIEKYVDLNATNIGVIIFSPPYPNSFDYFESYKLELVFGQFVNNINEISKLRSTAVRSFVNSKKNTTFDYYIDLLAKEIEAAIPKKEAETNKVDSRTRKVPDMIKGYFSDMGEIINQCGLCLAKGKKTYIVVDQSAYVGVIIPTDLLLAYLAEQRGFKVLNIIECRKCRTSTQQLNRFPYLKNALRESIVVLEKI